MLVLSRHQSEKIVINHEIEIVVIAIRHDRVRLGIKAPESIPVHRGEVEAQLQPVELQPLQPVIKEATHAH